MAERLKVAVLFGGLSPEHDVSVCTGLEVLQALDPEKYDGFPVYIGLDHQWWVGDGLRDIKTYIPDLAAKRSLTRVSFDIGNERTGGRWMLRAVSGGLLGGRKSFAVDVVMPILHGTYGEDGVLQGVLSASGVPYSGGDVGAMAVAMNKMWTANQAALADVPVLKSVLAWRRDGVDNELISRIKKGLGKYPLFVKPNFLGSSIGVHLVKDDEELEAALAEVFRMDTAAIVQPCVKNLVEYNVAVRRGKDGEIVTSAVERPLRKGDVLSFADKYAGSGANKLGNKVKPAAGMAMMDRVLNPPELDAARDKQLRVWAVRVFEALNLAGCPRLDFMMDGKTGEVWFNEINPIPGGLGYFLWEAAAERVSFTELLDGMVEEALKRAKTGTRVMDPVSVGGAIFRKRG